MNGVAQLLSIRQCFAAESLCLWRGDLDDTLDASWPICVSRSIVHIVHTRESTTMMVCKKNACKKNRLSEPLPDVADIGEPGISLHFSSCMLGELRRQVARLPGSLVQLAGQCLWPTRSNSRLMCSKDLHHQSNLSKSAHDELHAQVHTSTLAASKRFRTVLDCEFDLNIIIVNITCGCGVIAHYPFTSCRDLNLASASGSAARQPCTLL